VLFNDPSGLLSGLPDAYAYEKERDKRRRAFDRIAAANPPPCYPEAAGAGSRDDSSGPARMICPPPARSGCFEEPSRSWADDISNQKSGIIYINFANSGLNINQQKTVMGHVAKVYRDGGIPMRIEATDLEWQSWFVPDIKSKVGVRGTFVEFQDALTNMAANDGTLPWARVSRQNIIKALKAGMGGHAPKYGDVLRLIGNIIAHETGHTFMKYAKQFSDDPADRSHFNKTPNIMRSSEMWVPMMTTLNPLFFVPKSGVYTLDDMEKFLPQHAKAIVNYLNSAK
jgi:hypothetical protein